MPLLHFLLIWYKKKNEEKEKTNDVAGSIRLFIFFSFRFFSFAVAMLHWDLIENPKKGEKKNPQQIFGWQLRWCCATGNVCRFQRNTQRNCPMKLLDFPKHWSWQGDCYTCGSIAHESRAWIGRPICYLHLHTANKKGKMILLTSSWKGKFMVRSVKAELNLCNALGIYSQQNPKGRNKCKLTIFLFSLFRFTFSQASLSFHDTFFFSWYFGYQRVFTRKLISQTPPTM